MARTKIDYGIDLGTTNSAISRMENGEAKIIKVNGQDDTMPSCVSYNKKAQLVGRKAFQAYKSEQSSRISKDVDQNAFIEFKRTMGTDKKYLSKVIEKELTSEELSAEILKSLKSFVTDDVINAVVITVPAAFKNNQKEATREAAFLAGFTHVELLQEPVAAAMAYGLDTRNKNGFWLVFDFGGGTFDAALLKVEDGIMQVADTEGDNHLGGKTLDLEIVDKILIPNIQKKYNIDSIIDDDKKKLNYREALKPFAEEIKNELSFNNSFDLYKEDGAGFDDDGEEIEIEITVSREELENVVAPVFQRALDICLKLLKRNSLKGSDLTSLILVGGPTFSPIVRKMLEEQITKPDTSIDPMTVVAKGAALYASTLEISEEIREQTRDKSKIQLEIGHEASTVQLEEFVTLKILKDKTEGDIPEKVFAEVTRNDKAWSSGKVEINEIGEIVETHLIEGKTNSFEISLYDDRGNLLESEPKEFTIIQGSKIGSATLAYNVGFEIKKQATGKIVFETLKGLEKNKSIPSIGTRNGLKTQKQIRPGMEIDHIKIPLYEGEHNAEGTRAIYNEHFMDIIISGTDLPALLPAGSDVDLTVNYDRSEKITVKAYFPYLDYSYETTVERTVSSIDTSWLEHEISKAKGTLEELEEEGHFPDRIDELSSELDEIDDKFQNNRDDVDTKQETLSNLRKTLKKIDSLSDGMEWPKMEEQLKDEFFRLEKVNRDLGNDKTAQIVNHLRSRLEDVLQKKDTKLGAALLDDISELYFSLTMIYQLIGIIRNYNQNFGSYNWINPQRARSAINEGLQIIGDQPTVDELRPIVREIFDQLKEEDRPSDDDSVLVG